MARIHHHQQQQQGSLLHSVFKAVAGLLLTGVLLVCCRSIEKRIYLNSISHHHHDPYATTHSLKNAKSELRKALLKSVSKEKQKKAERGVVRQKLQTALSELNVTKSSGVRIHLLNANEEAKWTVVASYFPMKQVHDSEDSDLGAADDASGEHDDSSPFSRLSLLKQYAVVIFTLEEDVLLLREARGSAPTVIVSFPRLESLPVSLLDYSGESDAIERANAATLSFDFWHGQLEKSKEDVKNYETFWPRLCKTWFMATSVQANWFQSTNLFVWTDLDTVPDNFESLSSALHAKAGPEFSAWPVLQQQGESKRLVQPESQDSSCLLSSGSVTVARPGSWLDLHQRFVQTLDQILLDDQFVGDECLLLGRADGESRESTAAE